MVVRQEEAKINTDEGFEPHIEGRRIKVKQIARHYIHFDWPVEEIAEAFRLTLAQVHAALAYYYDHKEEIEKALREEDEFFDRLPTLDDLRLIMTPQEIADEYPITVDAVYQAIRRGRIQARKSGRAWLLLRRDVEDVWGRT
jgi:excisionase family DNA binding protein